MPEGQAQVTLSFAPVVKKAAPAVVNIFTSKKIKISVSPFMSDPFFRQFFGGGRIVGRKREKVVNSLGSGVIVRPDGIILTNNHVINGADAIKVELSDKREFDAKVLLTDERSDLAVLKVDSKEALPFLEMGNSDSLEVGDLVIAIGNPFGVGQTVTSGIISALSRTTAGVNDYQFFIQTDAAINPGNSGGALVTMQGELAGINTAIFSRSGGSNGIGFATPANMVRVVLESALTTGKVIRPWLGASGQRVTKEIAASLGMKKPIGVILGDVYPKGSAHEAGLMMNDIIIAIEDKEVSDDKNLRYHLATFPIGSTVTFTVLRGGEELSIPVVMTPPAENIPRQLTRLTGSNPLAGVEVGNLSPALADEVGVAAFKGVVITDIYERSPARAFGLKKGDIIININDTHIQSVNHLIDMLSESSIGWNIQVKRGSQMIEVNIKI